MKSKINFTPILNNEVYIKENIAFHSEEAKHARRRNLILLGIPLFWPYFIAKAIRDTPMNTNHEDTREKGLRDFAEVNNFQLHGHFGPHSIDFSEHTDEKPSLPMIIKGYFPHISMTGRIDMYPFEYGQYELQIYRNSIDLALFGEDGITEDLGGKPRRTAVSFLRLDLPVKLPRLFVDSKSNNLFEASQLPHNIGNLTKIEPEGDAYKYVDIYTEKDSEIDVLEVLSPEVLSFLVSNNEFDIWMHDNSLYIFRQGSLINYFASIPEIFPIAESLVNEIDRIANHVS